MFGKRYGIKVVTVLAVLTSLYLFVIAQTAAAQGSSWVRWLVDVTYPQTTNTIDMQLIVQMGYTTATGQNIIVDTHAEAATCQTVGSPVVQNGEATYGVGSYFQCDLPSPQQIAWDEWSFSIPSTCTVKKKPFVVSRLALEGNPVQVNPMNPLFYREDIQFGVPLDVPTQQAELVAKFGQALARSSSFASHPAGHTAVAIYDRIGANQFAPIFRENGNSLNATPAVVSGPIILSNLESTVYMGYSPTLVQFFEGTVGTTRVDPYCSSGG